MSNSKVQVIVFSSVIVVIMILAVLISSIGRNDRVKEYNNGVCIECGNNYSSHEHFEKGDGTMNIIYECVHCGKKGWVEKNAVE